MISYVLPTRDRPERLALTLAALGSLRGHETPGEVIVVDNASRFPPMAPERLANGLAVRMIHRSSNEGAASRNVGVEHVSAQSEWIVMLDDDSCPVDTGFIRRLSRAPADVAAVSADIYLPGLARRESGGLPEVFIGCGVAFRRRVFLELGGYDPAFNYYAEEYDLAARMILAGFRVAFDPWFRVEHHKVQEGRDVNTIMARLVRNNGWVMQRYAPSELRRTQIREQRSRYRAISAKENAMAGFARGLVELRATIRGQRRTPMPAAMFDRFTGLAYAREALQDAFAQRAFSRVAIVDEGKNGWVVRRALAEMGTRLVDVGESADALVVGSMSPGPMLDSFERRTMLNPTGPGLRVIAPWRAVTYKPAAGSEILTGGKKPDVRGASPAVA
jgi:GT2 family glycosyltransferase